MPSTSVYYVVFNKKPQQLLGVAGVHTCDNAYTLCWFGPVKKRSETYNTADEALGRAAEVFGGAAKVDAYEVDFREYTDYKRKLRGRK